MRTLRIEPHFVAEESWLTRYARLEAAAREDCRLRGMAYIDPLPFRTGKLGMLPKMSDFIKLAAVLRWHSDRKLSAAQANRGLRMAFPAARVQRFMPEGLLTNTFRYAGLVTDLSGIATRDDLPEQWELYRGARAGGNPLGYSWTPNLDVAAAYSCFGDDIDGTYSIRSQDLWQRAIYRGVFRRDQVLGVLDMPSDETTEVVIDPAAVEWSAIEELPAHDVQMVRLAQCGLVTALRLAKAGNLADVRQAIEPEKSLQWLLKKLEEDPNQWPFVPRSPSERWGNRLDERGDAVAEAA